ncbi:MAG TPA: cellulose binding domain-containing protein [Kineosporiaceae bacterium]|nr:cellulose binding domain-containing protein [Kineosporiaceae bacterium]
MRITEFRWLRTLAVVTALAVLTMVGTTLIGGLRGSTARAAAGGAAASDGCGKNPALASGDHSIQNRGKNRTYVLDVPQNYDRNHPYRLIFAPHWMGAGQGNVVGTQYYGLKPLSNGSAIFVAPQGLDAGWGNGGGEDVALFDEIAKQVEGALCVDKGQLFSAGFSFGAAMSYAIACERANVFRAVAIFSGGSMSGCNGGNDPIAVLESHGIGDPMTPFGWGEGIRDRFVKNNGCTPQEAKKPAPGSKTHFITNYAGCSAGHPVEWIAFDGGHDFTPTDNDQPDETTYLAQETWKFFSQFESSAPAPDPAPSRTTTTAAGTPAPTQATPGAGGASTAGCGKAPTLANGDHTIKSGGKDRTYVLDVPANYDNKHPYRLIFGFHWYGAGQGNVVGSQFYGLKPLSNNSTIFVSPQGLNAGWANDHGEDIALVDDIVKQVEGDLCVDKSQLFAMGFSYGGAMSFHVACERADVFRAAAAFSGGPIGGMCDNAKPIGYMISHGMSDMGLEGAAAARDGFAKVNGCTPQAPTNPAVGSKTHKITDYAGCSAGHPVRWVAFDGGHDFTPTDNDQPDDKTYLPAETWKFFTKFASTPSPAPTTPAPTTPAPTTPAPTTPAPTTPAPTTPAPTTPAPTTTAGATCTATYHTLASWSGGYIGEVTVTAGGSPVKKWTVRTNSTAKVYAVWNGVAAGNGTIREVGSPSWAGTLQPSASMKFGFIGSGSPTAPSLTCTAG